MNSIVNNVTREVTHHWETATPTEFGALALAIVLVGWFCTRFYGD